ncbi:MAG: permease [Deltaproteobacteria bacterium]|nr:permease [Deltaproteobacteria bacterium]
MRLRLLRIAFVVLPVGALLALKWRSSAGAISRAVAGGDLAARSGPLSADGLGAIAAPIVETANYLAIVWPALVLGLLIAAGVRAFLPARALARILDGGAAKQQLVAGLAGAPLMLCSCCVAPVFTSVYGRTRRLGPALGLMIGSPALNPAALILTFVLFSAAASIGRLAMALVAVLVASAVIGRLFGASAAPPDSTGAEEEAPATAADTFRSFGRSLAGVALRTVPLIVLGVIASVAIARALPVDWLASTEGKVATIAVVSLVAVPLALPTFFEIPLALALLAAGAPAGAAAALLFAGPAINLPSLFTVARSSSWRAAAALGAAVWLIAFAGGVAVG